MSGELISVAQMRAIDQAAVQAGVPSWTLMQNAGRAVATAIMARFKPQLTLVLCGPGNNGGDGWVAAQALLEAGWPVQVACSMPPEDLRGDAAIAASAWKGPVRTLGTDGFGASLYVDALFGAGLTRPLEGPSLAFAHIASGTPERVVAVDIPSGLHGDTGRPLGEACVRAALTVTFVRKKPAHLLMPGRELCGEVIVADIGAPEPVVAAQNVQVWENGPALWGVQFPWPNMEAHKHARGHALVASGGRGRSGAARLSARGALRIGAGLVSVLSPPEAFAENAAHLTAIMLREAALLSDYAEAAKAASALIIGPAFGIETSHRAKLDAVCAAHERCPLVLDADALTLLAPLTAKLRVCDVMTPHIGEFNRLFPDLLKTTASRLDATRAAAAQAGCVVLLKGPDTIIAAPDGRASINATGTPFLASAGAGDVLAGMICGLIAQGMPSFEAAAAGAWLHGRAGEAGGAGLIAEDISELLPNVLNGLAPERWRRRRDV